MDIQFLSFKNLQEVCLSCFEDHCTETKLRALHNNINISIVKNAVKN